MPEVFTNCYAFPAATVPPAEAFYAQILSQFGQPLELIKHERGDHGAPRAYACLRNDQMQIWIYWEPDRPSVEVSVDEPMERMIPINAAIVALGGQPRYPDQSWQARRRYRTFKAIRKTLIIAFLIALAAAIIWYLHWWGLLIVVATTLLAAGLYIIALARAFSHR